MRKPSPRATPPAPRPAPERTPEPGPTSAAAPPPPVTVRPEPPPPAPVALPHYRPATRPQPKGGTSVLTTTLVIIAPAVLATAILRSRSR
ncbi:hypothetical protein [Streptomyces sp. NPDC090093]|uniref:hypothetical protein n=1 Tax=Streptomyces sp. NPDC090093 TaxID=3365945 RepID=UPI0038236E6E